MTFDNMTSLTVQFTHRMVAPSEKLFSKLRSSYSGDHCYSWIISWGKPPFRGDCQFSVEQLHSWALVAVYSRHSVSRMWMATHNWRIDCLHCSSFRNMVELHKKRKQFNMWIFVIFGLLTKYITSICISDSLHWIFLVAPYSVFPAPHRWLSGKLIELIGHFFGIT